MKGLKRFLAMAALGAVAALALAGTAFSATYYVDYTNGYDANAGTSPTNAWKHCPGDGNATYSANMTPQPGDTIVFKGGTTYTLSSSVIAAKNSGTSGRVITYTSGHLLATPWGSGMAVIDASRAALTGAGVNGALALKNHSYITVSGLDIRNAPFVLYTGAIGWTGISGGNIIIDKCKLTGSDNGVYIAGDWNSINPANFTITNTECYGNKEHGILFRLGMYNVTVKNCRLHDNGPGPAPYLGDGIFFAFGNGTNVPTHVLVKGNTVYNHPTKGAFLLEGIRDAVFEDNFVYGVSRFWFGVARANSVTFRNNLFTGTFDLEPARINPSATVENIWFYNNTFAGTGARQQFWVNRLNSYVVRNITLQNNIFTKAGGGNHIYIASTTPIPGFVCNYNLYYGGSATPFQQYNSFYNLSGWRGVYNSDANSKMVDPRLDTTSYMPLSGSPSSAAGLNINSLAVVSAITSTGYAPSAFTVDKDGKPRPPGAWTLGCYELPSTALMPPIMHPPS